MLPFSKKLVTLLYRRQKGILQLLRRLLKQRVMLRRKVPKGKHPRKAKKTMKKMKRKMRMNSLLT